MPAEATGRTAIVRMEEIVVDAVADPAVADEIVDAADAVAVPVAADATVDAAPVAEDTNFFATDFHRSYKHEMATTSVVAFFVGESLLGEEWGLRALVCHPEGSGR